MFKKRICAFDIQSIWALRNIDDRLQDFSGMIVKDWYLAIKSALKTAFVQAESPERTAFGYYLQKPKIFAYKIEQSHPWHV